MQKHWIFIWRNMHACMITDSHWQWLSITDSHWQWLTVTDSHCQKRRRFNCRFCPLTVIISTDSDCQWFWQILDSHWQSADSHCQWTTFLVCINRICICMHIVVHMHAYCGSYACIPYAYACMFYAYARILACICMHTYMHMHAYVCIYACI